MSTFFTSSLMRSLVKGITGYAVAHLALDVAEGLWRRIRTMKTVVKA